MKTYIESLFTCLGVASREAWARLGAASTRSWVLPVLIAGLSLIPAGRVRAQTFRTLHNFPPTACFGCPNSDGAGPYAGSLTNSSGNTRFYGTTFNGGASGFGTVFAINTDGTGFTNLHSFTELPAPLYSTNSDGAYPSAGLILSGNTLYGSAGGGGTAGNGTVFALNADGTSFRILHTFTATTSGTNTDGAHPLAEMLLSGNTLYGTAGGGSSGIGTIFAVNTDGSGFTNLFNFSGTNGGGPVSILSGNTLYGTGGGGSLNSGTVFAIKTDGTGFTNLYTFTAAPGPYYTNSDGVGPRGLCLSGNTLYGVAAFGGPYWSAKFSDVSGNGTVFAINTDGTAFRTLHSFTASGNTDGITPIGGLTLSGNTLYGTAQRGGSSGWGTAFALNIDGTGFTNLHSFTRISNPDSGYGSNSDGALPQTALLLSGDAFYGTAFGGGTSANGTVFSISFRPQLTITPSGTNVVLSWPTNVAGFDYTSYTLQSAPALTGPFTNLPAAKSAYTNPITGPQQFYRLVQ